MNKDNVEAIYDKGLCHECGLCVAICPLRAIELSLTKIQRYKPIINSSCNNCSICLTACPGINPYHEQNTSRFNVNNDSIVGSYISIGLYQATEKSHLVLAASGGVVTSILANEVEMGFIDGAVVTVIKKLERMGYRPVSHFATDKEDIFLSAGSVYQPVPQCTGLAEMKTTANKVGFVGLPCHIHGLRNAEKILQSIGRREWLRIGLFCTIGRSRLGTEYVLRKVLGIKPETVCDISYRYGEYPGELRVSTGSHQRTLAYEQTLSYIDYLFLPWRCLMCADLFNEHADLSAGDAWGQLESKSATLLIIRTPRGKQAVDRALRVGKIRWLRDVSLREVKASQAAGIRYKKKNLATRLKIMQTFHLPTPNGPILQISPGDLTSIVGNAILCLTSKAQENPLFATILSQLPPPFLRKFRALVAKGAVK